MGRAHLGPNLKKYEGEEELMFEITIKVKVDTKNDKAAGATSVENSITLHGKSVGELHTKTFDNPLDAYMFVGQYFYDMVEELAIKSGMMPSVIDILSGNKD